MKITYQPEHELSDDNVRAATGKSWDDWFRALDKFGGPSKGRKALSEFLAKKNGMDAWWSTTVTVEYEKARQAHEKDGRPKGYNICVTKAIKARPADVFAAFSDPRKLAQWFGAGTKLEFREGGKFEDANGHCGEYKKINPGKALRFTWEGKRHTPGEVVEVKLQLSGAKCSVILTHDRMQTRDVADGMRAAWGRALEQLQAQLEG